MIEQEINAFEQAEQMSDQDLLALVEQEVQPELQPQPRDEQGRFVKAEPTEQVEEEPVAQAEPEAEEPQPTVYRRVIDLGDGAGKQVFEADNVDGLVDKLVKAQEHATKKIREQAEQLRIEEEQRKAEEASNDYIYSQELITKPTAAFKKLFKQTTGLDIDTFKTKLERVEAFESAQAAREAATAQETEQAEASKAFVDSHPEYIGNGRNGQLLVDRIELLQVRAQKKGENPDYQTLLEKAYQDLKSNGLLQLKDEEADVDTETKETGKQRIAEPASGVPPQRSPKKASSISTKGRVPPAKSPESPEDLSTEQLEAIVRKEFAPGQQF
jgi:hypothetical protein